MIPKIDALISMIILYNGRFRDIPIQACSAALAANSKHKIMDLMDRLWTSPHESLGESGLPASGLLH